jgi:hypothetical protein
VTVSAARFRAAAALAVTLDAAALRRWRRQPTAFVEEVLHDPETGKPYRLMRAERAFLEHAFKTDARGRLRRAQEVRQDRVRRLARAHNRAAVRRRLSRGGDPGK